MTNTLTKSRIGINKVATVVENLWESGWQEYASQNDDAFDGVIIMKRGSKKPVATGGMVFVQVKCGSEGYKKLQKQHPDHIGLSLGSGYLNKHIPRWNKAPGPAILVFVDDGLSRENPPAYWVNLKDEAVYSNTNKGMLLVPKVQRFGHHSKGDFHRLCGSQPADQDLQEIALNREDGFIPKLGKKNSLRWDAWAFYTDWRRGQGIDISPAVGPVLVNRIGWEHISRSGRMPEKIVHSWLLLGAARALISKCERYWTLGNARLQLHNDGNQEVIDYLGLRAKVTFSYRHYSVVQVVLRRSRLVDPTTKSLVRQKIWFYSVYELRRGVVPA